MELSIRLQAVADMVEEKSRVADIGCDHGYVSIYLFKEKRCSKVIAMDVKKGPLERAKTNIDRYGLSDYIQTRLSDGMGALKEKEADTLLLSGMGGRLTIRILQEGFKRLGKDFTLILQPQSEIFLVRAFLREQGIEIVDENMVLDQGKYYPIIKALGGEIRQKAEKSHKTPAAGKEMPGALKAGCSLEIMDYFGPVLLYKRPPVFLDFLSKEKEKTEKLLLSVTKPERKEELKSYLSYVQTAQNYL